ncbi:DUF2092 domain-containing protein [Deefgea tanakiae]|uniref:DUF2092 domain-containing protein n=1 Tax=Deefgea tanakiae TaxID=2865840 RepID=A0ABX8Z2F3_9NEIS|nr:DUF2092 domain-containing protein [Deefgea tanakiae]QZA76758.1 DUF2092 domain-containing protein [Deefgea tanakiae]
MKQKLPLCYIAFIPFSLSVFAAESNESQVNPLVVAKAVEVGQHLRSLPKVEVTAQTTLDVTLKSGQKIQSHGTSQMVADGKNRLYMNIDSDSITREYFFDGKNLTQYSPPLQYYTTIDMPGTAAGMLNKVEAHYGIHLPLKALFTLGSDQEALSKLTSAVYIGPSKINGKVCDHLAFSQPGADWQLWVSRDKNPLPCKLVVTKTDETSQPQTSQTFAWNLKPFVSPSEFTFKPAKGDVAIPLKKLAE